MGNGWAGLVPRLVSPRCLSKEWLVMAGSQGWAGEGASGVLGCKGV